MTALVDYLALCGLTAHDVRVKIDRSIYNAAEYKDNGQDVLLVVGGLPSSKRRRNKTVYRFPGDTRDWYVACYATPKCLQLEYAAFHPMGITFQLRPWDHKESIDHFDTHKYTRRQADISRTRF